VVLRVETSRETPSTSATLEVAPRPHLDGTGHRGMAAMPASRPPTPTERQSAPQAVRGPLPSSSSPAWRC